MTQQQPHIVYILSDEHRGQAMSHQGDPNVSTPHMDRLASEGVSFSRAYANCPICTPSRGTIFSGRHAHCGPVPGFFSGYPAAAPSLATELHKAGYHSTYLGKWHCGIVYDQLPPTQRENPQDFRRWRQRTPEDRRAGFRDWCAFEVNNAPFDSYVYHNQDVEPVLLDGYQTDALTDLTIRYLEQYDREEPLLLVLSIEPPHFPLEVPQQWQRFDSEQLDVRPNFHDTPAMRRELAMYYAMIENLDWNVGRLMAAIQANPRFAGDRTLSVYLSDHGDFLGSHRRTQRKEHPHEESVRIPAIFHWPGVIPQQGSVDGLFSLVDLLPSTLALVGCKPPAWSQGTDLSSAILGKPVQMPQEVLLEMHNSPRWTLDYPDWRGLVTPQYKYAYYENGAELLFDLEADPYEQQNLAEERAKTCLKMNQRLLAHLARTREPYFDVIMEYGERPERQVRHVGATHYPIFHCEASADIEKTASNQP